MMTKEGNWRKGISKEVGVPDRLFEKVKLSLSYQFLLAYLLYAFSFAALFICTHAYHMGLVALFATVSTFASLVLLHRRRRIYGPALLFCTSCFISTTSFILVGREGISVLFGAWYILLLIFAYINLGKKTTLAYAAAIVLTFNPIAFFKFNDGSFWADAYLHENIYHISIATSCVFAFSFIFLILQNFVDGRVRAETNLKEVTSKQSDLNDQLSETLGRLSHSQQKLHAIVQAIPDAMIMMDRDANIIEYLSNTVDESYHNLKLEDMGLSPEQIEEIKATIRRTIESNEINILDLTYADPVFAGYLEARYIPCGNEQVICMARDITSRKKAQAEIEEYKHFIERVIQTTPDMIWIQDYSTHQTIFSNKGIHEVLGYSQEYMEQHGGSFLTDHCHPDDIEIASQNIASALRLSDGEVADVDFRVKDVQGQWHWVRTFRTPFLRNEHGQVTQLLVTAQDITAQKQIEAELVLAKEKAEQASIAKAHFLSTMSHEIRTPMNAVIGFTHLLIQEEMRPEQKEYLRILQFSANHLLALINDILDYSKIEAGKIELEETEFDLSELLSGVYNIFSLKAEEKQLKFALKYNCEPARKLIGDPVRLSQVLTNLLSNAIKFTDKGSVVIEYRITGETADRIGLCFTVKDTGIGIAPDKLEQIFDSFTQASADTTRKFGGTGLGLAISKKLVEMQGGQLRVSSTPGEGSAFSFELSFRLGSSSARNMIKALPEQELMPSLKGLRVLVVEDNEINTLVVKKFLSKWDALVDTAADGIIGVDKVQHNEYDLVLMDLQMPGMNGYEAVAQIRAMDTCYARELPVIAMTASVSTDVKTEVLSHGMNDYVTKPFNPGHLYKVIARYIPHKRA